MSINYTVIFSFHNYRLDTYSCIPVNAEHTDPPIDVDQTVAYHKFIELQDNVCCTTSSRNKNTQTNNGSM